MEILKFCGALAADVLRSARRSCPRKRRATRRGPRPQLPVGTRDINGPGPTPNQPLSGDQHRRRGGHARPAFVALFRTATRRRLGTAIIRDSGAEMFDLPAADAAAPDRPRQRPSTVPVGTDRLTPASGNRRSRAPDVRSNPVLFGHPRGAFTRPDRLGRCRVSGSHVRCRTAVAIFCRGLARGSRSRA